MAGRALATTAAKGAGPTAAGAKSVGSTATGAKSVGSTATGAKGAGAAAAAATGAKSAAAAAATGAKSAAAAAPTTTTPLGAPESGNAAGTQEAPVVAGGVVAAMKGTNSTSSSASPVKNQGTLGSTGAKASGRLTATSPDVPHMLMHTRICLPTPISISTGDQLASHLPGDSLTGRQAHSAAGAATYRSDGTATGTSRTKTRSKDVPPAARRFRMCLQAATKAMADRGVQLDPVVPGEARPAGTLHGRSLVSAVSLEDTFRAAVLPGRPGTGSVARTSTPELEPGISASPDPKASEVNGPGAVSVAEVSQAGATVQGVSPGLPIPGVLDRGNVARLDEEAEESKDAVDPGASYETGAVVAAVPAAAVPGAAVPGAAVAAAAVSAAAVSGAAVAGAAVRSAAALSASKPVASADRPTRVCLKRTQIPRSLVPKRTVDSAADKTCDDEPDEPIEEQEDEAEEDGVSPGESGYDSEDRDEAVGALLETKETVPTGRDAEEQWLRSSLDRYFAELGAWRSNVTVRWDRPNKRWNLVVDNRVFMDHHGKPASGTPGPRDDCPLCSDSADPQSVAPWAADPKAVEARYVTEDKRSLYAVRGDPAPPRPQLDPRVSEVLARHPKVRREYKHPHANRTDLFLIWVDEEHPVHAPAQLHYRGAVVPFRPAAIAVRVVQGQPDRYFPNPTALYRIERCRGTGKGLKVVDLVKYRYCLPGRRALSTSHMMHPREGAGYLNHPDYTLEDRDYWAQCASETFHRPRFIIKISELLYEIDLYAIKQFPSLGVGLLPDTPGLASDVRDALLRRMQPGAKDLVTEGTVSHKPKGQRVAQTQRSRGSRITDSDSGPRSASGSGSGSGSGSETADESGAPWSRGSRRAREKTRSAERRPRSQPQRHHKHRERSRSRERNRHLDRDWDRDLDWKRAGSQDRRRSHSTRPRHIKSASGPGESLHSRESEPQRHKAEGRDRERYRERHRERHRERDSRDNPSACSRSSSSRRRDRQRSPQSPHQEEDDAERTRGEKRAAPTPPSQGPVRQVDSRNQHRAAQTQRQSGTHAQRCGSLLRPADPASQATPPHPGGRQQPSHGCPTVQCTGAATAPGSQGYREPCSHAARHSPRWQLCLACTGIP